MHRKKGFTLMELIIVVVIIGILALIGMPQFFTVAEKARAGEGYEILGSIRSSQLRFAAESPTKSSTATLAQLDIAPIPTLKYFKAPTVKAVTDPSGTGAASTLASIVRNGGTTAGYTLTITGGGTISCSGTGCPAKMPQ